jgi:hypothetical protein
VSKLTTVTPLVVISEPFVKAMWITASFIAALAALPEIWNAEKAPAASRLRLTVVLAALGKRSRPSGFDSTTVTLPTEGPWSLIWQLMLNCWAG